MPGFVILGVEVALLIGIPAVIFFLLLQGKKIKEEEDREVLLLLGVVFFLAFTLISVLLVSLLALFGLIPIEEEIVKKEYEELIPFWPSCHSER